MPDSVPPSADTPKRTRDNRQHGTHSRYVQGCRCDECREARRSYMAEYRARKKKEAATDSAWVDWLARNNYGVDFNFSEDPPCSLDELADAYVRVHGEENRDSWAWCIRQETGAFGGVA